MSAKSDSGRSPVLAAKEDAATAEDIAAPPEAINMTEDEELGAANDKDQSDSGKLKTLMGILRRMVGVKDIAAIRLSLPANLLEPTPNLEYWTYLDRGDIFTSVADLDDPLDRMLAVLRFHFTMELKFIKGKVCKPYNSILGEHFRCHWDVDPLTVSDDGKLIPVQTLATESPEPMPLANGAASVPTARSEKKVEKPATPATEAPAPPTPVEEKPAASMTKGSGSDSGSTKKSISRFLGRAKRGNHDSKDKDKEKESQGNGAFETSSQTGTAQASVEDLRMDAASISGGSIKTNRTTSESGKPSKRRINFLTEQVSHHPPISSFFCEAKDAGVQLYGVDQLGAKFTGTSVKVFPGEQNKGVFLRLTEKARCGAAGEEYQITHPTALINGLLRGSLWVAICDNLYITCRNGKRGGDDGSRLRTIVEYKDESWLSKAKYAVEGCIYECGANDDAEEFKSVKQVPSDRVVATFEGSWRTKITYKRKGDKEPRLLINLEDLDPIAKTVRPLAAMEELESRRIWEPVTSSILAKDFNQATKNKQVIEQRQRDAAAERKRKGETFVPRFFDADISDGRPKLTAEGQRALDGEDRLEGYDAKDASAAPQSATANVADDDDDDDDDDEFKDASEN
ncbi:uncharacterized protein PFL1_04993 [Pseudozyma flocculosa PF-1]|uniref:Related to OSH6 - member of an oxysterol-binding protein family n=2 Tax=Pseudozyma flocculosa TaxID=84751 RepID=A0A5C3EWY7_9BASI|nr:uncharacterized protein PFL1_04993 [Pseudozyma flocculosa PF-1]EPQ27455.1 hypothetical protein PFL1_04993 [Pseudozyma flocculosa PF-1]SPO36116.1 related to OSH6 - member of an oxysterol-binding protein family [Pseudozyma flocculosa]